MPPKSFLREVIYPLIMRFAVVITIVIALSLGLALITSALDDNQPNSSLPAQPPIRNISNDLPEAPEQPLGQAVQVNYHEH